MSVRIFIRLGRPSARLPRDGLFGIGAETAHSVESNYRLEDKIVDVFLGNRGGELEVVEIERP
jgi:hypothetical protein